MCFREAVVMVMDVADSIVRMIVVVAVVETREHDGRWGSRSAITQV